VNGGLGDVVMTRQGILLLKREYPSAAITVFVPKKSYGIISLLFSDVVVRPFSIVAVMLHSCVSHYDIAVSNSIAAFSVRFELCARISSHYCCGFRYPSENEPHRLYDFSTDILDSEHDSDQLCQLMAKSLLIKNVSIEFPSQVSAPGNIKTAMIHPGVSRGYAYKQWPLERVIALCKELAQRGFRVTVLAGPDDDNVIPVCNKIPDIALLQSPSPSVLVGALKSTTVFIGNDSGPAHVSALLGTPTITLIGPVDPRRSAPRGCRSSYIYVKERCSPCHFTNQQCNDNTCMKAISVDMVLAEIDKLSTHSLSLQGTPI
jgi:ADP-heptose:LPS heptosyltransferase